MKHALLFVAFALTSALVSAQVVGTGYTFSATNGTYTPITGTVVSAPTDDENVYFASGKVTPMDVGGSEEGTGFPIGFTFRYGGQNYTTFAIGSNGYIKLGNAGNINLGLTYHDIWVGSYAGGSAYASASSLHGIIMPLLRDFQFRSTSVCSYENSGTAPNRVCITQWSDVGTWSSGGPLGTFNLQVRLNEGSNTVQFVYGTSAAAGGLRAFILGLRGNSNDDHYLIAGVPGSETRSTDPSILNSTANIFGLGGTTNFTSGRTFTFSPVTTSLEDETELSVRDLRAFPTVMRNELTVQGSLERPASLELRLDDASGRNHTVRNLNGTSTLDERMDVSSLAAGFYVLSVSDGKAVQRIKLVKQ